LKSRQQAELAERKRIDEIEFKKIQEKSKLREVKKEQKRIAAALEKSTYKAAEAKVREKELKRQAEEKVLLVEKIFAGEEKRNRWWIGIAVFFIISIIALSVLITIWYIAVSAIFIIVVISTVLAYKAYHFPLVEPIVVDEKDLLDDILHLQMKLKEENEQRVKEKDLKFEEQLRKEKKEMKKRKADRLAKEKLDAEFLELSRLQRIEVAKESFRKMEEFKLFKSSLKIKTIHETVVGDDEDRKEETVVEVANSISEYESSVESENTEQLMKLKDLESNDDSNG